MTAKFKPQKMIAVDVDGTIYVNGRANLKLIEWLRRQKSKGFKIMLWSARGEDHAKNAAKVFEIEDLFDIVCSKPGYIVDDMGWQWTKWTKRIRTVEEDAES
jgi:hydroxymethylpyrimidine pyrophosphatase-like HAD family hydrolase